MVKLLSEVLFSEMGCPVCGSNKSQKARTCRTCFETIGFEATKAVDEVIATYDRAVEGNAVAAQGAFKRQMVFGPVLAQIRIDKNAIFHKAYKDIKAYWDCEKSVKGGFVSLYIFGAEEIQRGTMVTALVEFKNKEHRPGDIVHYLRAQIVPAIVTSDIKLQLTKQEDSGTLIPGLPVEFIEEEYEKKGEKIIRSYAVGFQYADKNARSVNQDPLINRLVDTMMNNNVHTEACAG